MEYSMFRRHPQTNEVMALRNADVKMRECQERLEDKGPVSRGKLNITAVDMCGSYANLIEFIYLRKHVQAPIGENLQQLLERLLADENEAFRTDLLSHMPVVVSWRETKMPLVCIETTAEEVQEVYEKLSMFYNWVDTAYFPR